MLNLNHLLLLATVATLPFSTTAAPTTTTTNPTPNLTHPSPVTTHTVIAGRGGGGLRFDPDNIVAAAGSVIEFHFLPANHSVVEAAFDAPCVPKNDTSFDSGFFPVAASADGAAVQSGEVFQFVVGDEERPVWFYCAQGRHCMGGMVGVVNQGFGGAEGGKTLGRFRDAAKGFVGVSASQGAVQGGWRGENPNPLAGF
ncbi:uncharacterized protein B0H64DRAFT_478350 [Chaetomium fimeti]|uniref:Extracellular serine-rich protein n=1 Tax=Chaetomium fimeti TaxID=1854472 RepID=A0AAE0H7W6_9PEZI|nr:hypothetical protein B0H64DRAFT_478350 [Chaetomium fimeti]